MSKLHIEDIRITYQGHDLSQYGLFPLLAWYLMDVIKLPEYFEQVTVNKKRDKRKSYTFSDSQMCMGLLSLPILGIPFPNSKSKKHFHHYGILENLAFSLEPFDLFKFYHGRQTIENFFKESVDFEVGKMPSQKERANEAYLQLTTIAENCCRWFKKTFSLKNGIQIQ